jgi:two-component system response regulator AtoC
MAEILIVDDDRNLRETLRELLQSAGYDTRTAADGREATALLQHALPDLVLCDWKMPDINGEQFLRSLQSQDVLTTMPVIIMTAHGTGPNALQAMQLGAYDFITKPLDMDQALATVGRAIRQVELQREVEALRGQRFRDNRDENATDETDGQATLIGTSSAWIEIFKSIGKVAGTDVGVLLLGESGTGKGLVARAIHENSHRSRRPFIVVNCATLPADLLESELFGHERGSFTGAYSQKTGKFEAAAGGTIFLDEIGELPLPLQPKLLRVLQERTFERVGGTLSIAADVRVVAATNRPLEEEVAAKNFRTDLFYRLNGFTIHLPPLRDRRADILPLAYYFLRRYADRNGTAMPILTEDAIHALEQHSFPGNVRELEHLTERLSVQTGGRAITGDHLESQLSAGFRQPGDDFDLKSLLELPFHQSVALWERRVIEHALDLSAGNKSEAARRLGMHRRLLYEKLQQLGMA